MREKVEQARDSQVKVIAAKELFADAWAAYLVCKDATHEGEPRVSVPEFGRLVEDLSREVSVLRDTSRNPRIALTEKETECLDALVAVAQAYADSYLLMRQPVRADGYIVLQRNSVDQFDKALEIAEIYNLTVKRHFDTPSEDETLCLGVEYPSCIWEIWWWADDRADMIRGEVSLEDD